MLFWNTFYGLCAQKGVAPNNVAAAIGVSSATVTGWKNGAMPRIKVLKQLAEYFEVPVEVFTEKKSSENGYTPAPHTFNYDRFRDLIEEKGITRAHLCTLVGRPRHYINDVLRQKNKIPVEYQRIFAEALGTTVEYLNGETDQKEKAILSDDLSDGVKEIMELAQTMSNAELALLLEKAKKIKGV